MWTPNTSLITGSPPLRAGRASKRMVLAPAVTVEGRANTGGDSGHYFVADLVVWIEVELV